MKRKTLKMGEDGWLYVDDKKHKKWFSFHLGVKYWEPKLKDILKLETQYNKWKQICKEYHKNIWKPVFDTLDKAGGKGHCKPTHKFTGDRQWWEYVISDYPEMGKCYSFHWIDKPKKLLNYKITQRFYEVNRRMDQLNQRLLKVDTIFKLALDNFMRKTYPVTMRDLDKLKFITTPNGNEYLFRVENIKGWCFWKLISEMKVDREELK